MKHNKMTIIREYERNTEACVEGLRLILKIAQERKSARTNKLLPQAQTLRNDSKNIEPSELQNSEAWLTEEREK